MRAVLFTIASPTLLLHERYRNYTSTMPFLKRPSINAEPDTKDQELLAELGYKQELKRDWSVLHNFGVSFSIISVIVRIFNL